MSIVDQCVSDFFTVTECKKYHGKWIPTVAWKHLIVQTTDKVYTESAVTRALKLLTSKLESASDSKLKLFHTVKNHVNFFYVQSSNRKSPKIASDSALWRKRYDLYVSKYQAFDSSENCTRKTPPPQ